MFCNLNTDKLSKKINKEPSCCFEEVCPAVEKTTYGFSLLVFKGEKTNSFKRAVCSLEVTPIKKKDVYESAWPLGGLRGRLAAGKC